MSECNSADSDREGKIADHATLRECDVHITLGSKLNSGHQLKRERESQHVGSGKQKPKGIINYMNETGLWDCTSKHTKTNTAVEHNSLLTA